jgi:two-component system phosphate regulon sensor histidine kinase PhoR
MRHRRRRGALLWGGLTALGVVLLGELGWFAGLEFRAYDAMLRRWPARASDDRVAIIEIRDDDLRRLGRWPWPMKRHAELLDSLRDHYRARAAAFDILFLEPEAEPKSRRAFVSAVRRFGRVYLAAFFTERPQAVSGRARLVRVRYAGSKTAAGMRYQGLSPPFPELAGAAAGIGPANIWRELDGVVRRVPLALDLEGEPCLTLNGLILNEVLNPRGQPVVISPARWLAFGKRRVPVDEAGEILLSYRPGLGSEPGSRFRKFSYSQVLDKLAPAGALRGRVVLVTFTATGLADTHPVPWAPGAQGAEISAQALNTALAGNFILRAPRWLEVGLAIALGLAMGLAVPALRPGRSIAFAASCLLLVFLIAAGVFSAARVWIGWVTPVLAGLAAYGLLLVRSYREAEEKGLRARVNISALARATRVIASSASREELLEVIRDQITDAMGARQTDLFFLDASREWVVLLPRRETRGFSVRVGEGLVGWVARHDTGHLLSRVGRQREAEELRQVLDFPVGSVAHAPLRRRGEVVGVVQVARGEQDDPLEERDLPLLLALGDEVSVALENAELYDQLSGKVELANRELVRAAGELKEERDRVRALVENMADGVILTDPELKVVYVNPAAEEMFSLRAAEAEGCEASEVFGFPELIALFRAPESERPEEGVQLRVEKPSRMILAPRAVYLRDSGGNWLGTVTVVSDVTLIQELSDLKTEFVSLVSHELRTPLTSIQGFAQTLRGEAGDRFDEATKDEFLSIIQQECNRLVVMINDLLDISRMEAGRPLSMNLRPVELPALVERVLTFQGVTTDRHTFSTEVEGKIPPVRADRDKVEQILTNLISNAIKYSPTGGKVTVRLSAGEGSVVTSISDEGVGISPEAMGKLFQRFQRADRDVIKGIRGTGLGLYLVKGLVEAHGGSIRVESEVGTGSTFSFRLSVATSQETERTGIQPSARGETEAASGRRVAGQAEKRGDDSGS